MSGCRKRIVNRTVLPLRLGVHPPATGPTERQIASTEAKQKLRESRCIHAFVPDEHSGGLFESCKDPDMASPMLMIPTARLQAEPSDENEGETNEPGLKKLIENEKVGRVEDTEKKEMRDWGRHVNELCCDAEAWQNSPLPYNLLKWPSESKQINICAATMGPTCDDFLKLNRDTRTTKPKKPILPMITEYKAMIDQPDNMLPVEKPKVLASYAPRANMLDPLPPRYAANAEYWQAVNADIWDRTMSNTRDIVKKPFDVLPDAKAPSKKYIRRKYGKDTDWLEPDEELLELSQTDKLRVELKKPMSGYTGTRRNYYNPCWPRAVDDKPSYNDYVYKTTSHLSHRSFPPSEYCIRSSTFGRKGDLSRAVTNLIPPHPFRLYRRERFGRWDVDVPTHKFW